MSIRKIDITRYILSLFFFSTLTSLLFSNPEYIKLLLTNKHFFYRIIYCTCTTEFDNLEPQLKKAMIGRQE